MPVPIQPPIELSLNQPIHFIGAGGIGMSGLAKILLQAGFTVSGSDKRENAQLEKLRQLGGHMVASHGGDNVPENALVVCSTAISPDNPEVTLAQQRGQTVVHRATLLRAILHSQAFPNTITIGVTGSHGKTSTTGMITAALMAGGLSPTAVAGGLFPQTLENPLTNAIYGQPKTRDSAIAVAELDESDGSLEAYTPTITVLLNLEMDHAEHFPGGLTELKASIKRFLAGLAENNTPRWLIANSACPEVASLLGEVPSNVTIIPFSWWHPQSESYTLENVSERQPGRFSGILTSPDTSLTGELQMTSPGKHQLGNGAVALVVAQLVAQQLKETSINLSTAAEGINTFTGMGRRFEVVGEQNGAILVDDYAHHPTEIAAMLAVGKQITENAGKLYAIFEPHRYSRLQQFWKEFQTALAPADTLWVTDVYEASEPPRPGIDSVTFIEELQQRYPEKPIFHLPKPHWAKFLQTISPLHQGDVVMSLGAGDVTHLLRPAKSCQVAPQAVGST